MNETELQWTEVSGKRTLVIGKIPRISIDSRIRSPRTFDGRGSPTPPAPPTQRYTEIALKAAQKVMAATWFFRQYIEVIKIGYVLHENDPDKLLLTAGIVFVIPTSAEKVAVEAEPILVGFNSCWPKGKMPFDLSGKDGLYDAMSLELANRIVLQMRKEIQVRRSKFDEQAKAIQLIQDVFAESL